MTSATRTSSTRSSMPAPAKSPSKKKAEGAPAPEHSTPSTTNGPDMPSTPMLKRDRPDSSLSSPPSPSPERKKVRQDDDEKAALDGAAPPASQEHSSQGAAALASTIVVAQAATNASAIAATLFGGTAPSTESTQPFAPGVSANPATASGPPPELAYSKASMLPIPLDAFEDGGQKLLWATSVPNPFTSNNKVVLLVNALPIECGITNPATFDPSLDPSTHYSTMPHLPRFQPTGFGNAPSDRPTDAAGNPMVPALSLADLKPYSLKKRYVESLLAFRSSDDGLIANAARVDPRDYAAKEAWSRPADGPRSAFEAVYRSNLKSVTWVSLGACFQSNLVLPRSPSSGFKGPTYKCISILGHRVEQERANTFFCTLFQEDGIQIQLNNANNTISYQTKYKKNNAAESNDVSNSTHTTPSTTSLGNLRIGTVASVSPTKVSASRWTSGFDWDATIPVYDARKTTFDVADIDRSLIRLRDSPYFGEVTPGAYVLVGYGAFSNRYNSQWRASFYIKWVVVLAE
ncbi:hypothetical protein NMY22_g17180 [Coprinellus aureogranulatus]|nr:hypothetical protein NMY22_g17180 [Coprinellus aureogranulatus]